MDHLVGDDGVIRGPAGRRARRASHGDIARAAVTVLLDPAAHAGRTYDLTGPEALSFAEWRPSSGGHRADVTFHDETVEEAYASRAVRRTRLAGRRLGLHLHGDRGRASSTA